MLIVPRTLDELLIWGDAHSVKWQSSFAAIGLTSAQAADFTAALNDARAARAAAAQLEQARRSATAEYQEAVRNLRASAAEALASIKAYAERQENPHSVFSAAHIPAPQQPSPAPPPGRPDSFSFSILSSGSFLIKWKCSNPYGTSGTIYEVQRSIDDGPFAILGHSGTKKFLDTAVPAGSAHIVYRVTAMRSTVKGAMNVFALALGVNDAGRNRMAA